MKLFFIRHGEADYGVLESRGVRGWARSFAPLTPKGRVQIDVIARDYRLEAAEAILASSYSRALESAARLSRALDKPLHVEYDLHEWLPQKDSLGEMDESEEDLLDRAWGLTPTSRLSCQAIVSNQDVTVEIPKYSINHAREKH